MTQTFSAPAFCLSLSERTLLRRLVLGWSLEDAAFAAGLPLPDAQAALDALQARAGVSGLPRLLALAVLHAWV